MGEENTPPAPSVPSVPSVPSLDHPVYAEFDLGEYAEHLRGRMITLLQNPTRAFQRAYRKAAASASLGISNDEFWPFLAAVLDIQSVEQVETLADSMEPDALQWLFLFTVDDYDDSANVYGTRIEPHLFAVWNRWTTAQVKARAGRFTPPGGLPSAAAPAPLAAADE